MKMKREKFDKITGARLKSLRESKGIRANFVAEKLGIKGSYLSQLEAGERRWFAAMVHKYEGIVNP